MTHPNACKVCGEIRKITSEFKIYICINKNCSSRTEVFESLNKLSKQYSASVKNNEDYRKLNREFKNRSAKTSLIDNEIDGLIEYLNSYELMLIYILENTNSQLYSKINGNIIWKKNMNEFKNTITKNNGQLPNNLLNKFYSIANINTDNKRKRDALEAQKETERLRNRAKVHKKQETELLLAKKNLEARELEEKHAAEKKEVESSIPNAWKRETRKIDSVFIFDLDNTLRYEVDNTPIPHTLDLLENLLEESVESNLIYIASCNTYNSVYGWSQGNISSDYIDKVSLHAPICSEGFKNLSSVIKTFDYEKIQIHENTNIFVIGDTFKDMNSIQRIQQLPINEINPSKNWYFIRAFYGLDKIVKDYLTKNPNKLNESFVYPFEKSEKFYNYDAGDLYFLPDAVLLPAPDFENIGMLITDKNNFIHIKEFENAEELYIKATYGPSNSIDLNIDKGENEKFQEEFNVAILGRYFRTSITQNNDPKYRNAREIMDFKKNGDMPRNLKSSLDKFFIEQLYNFQTDNEFEETIFERIIICSVPNSDKGYRFRPYLLHLEEVLKNQIQRDDLEIVVMTDEFILQTEIKAPNHFTKGIEARMENVKGKYALTKEPTLATTFVYVLDDVLTSGSTFNEIFGVLAQYCLGYSGVVLGKHQSEPYTDLQTLVNYNYLPISAPVDVLRPYEWSDRSYKVSNPDDIKYREQE